MPDPVHCFCAACLASKYGGMIAATIGAGAGLVKEKHLRRLTIFNDTGERLRVRLTFRARTPEGKWLWFPEHAASPAATFRLHWTIDPLWLLDPTRLIPQNALLPNGVPLSWGGEPVLADRVRIWAQGLESGRVWSRHRHADYVLARQPYLQLSHEFHAYSFGAPS